MAISICVRLGKRIKDLRRKKGWRQIDLAEHSGIGKNHISTIERGERELGLMSLEAIAGALEIKPSDLLKGIED
ncbi:helix-turn-helix domain-containing protein [Acidicapsa ligni]|uniref:helix-turn-helix domain-containing protein n=1 Tax=Acidicapsa ligni TaxID=542300 RepID=UPI0021DF93BF|nr:helix-turn-helix transcriptional regulator [Acidicapsa ligni]